MVFLDGAYHEQGDALVWEQLGHLQSREVGRVLETPGCPDLRGIK